MPIVFLFSAMRVAMLLIVLLSASTIPASVAKPVLRFSPAQIRLGEWVTVTWEGIPDAALNLKTSEYICSQDSYCRRAHCIAEHERSSGELYDRLCADAAATCRCLCGLASSPPTLASPRSDRKNGRKLDDAPCSRFIQRTRTSCCP